MRRQWLIIFFTFALASLFAVPVNAGTIIELTLEPESAMNCYAAGTTIMFTAWFNDLMADSAVWCIYKQGDLLPLCVEKSYNPLPFPSFTYHSFKFDNAGDYIVNVTFYWFGMDLINNIVSTEFTIPCSPGTVTTVPGDYGEKMVSYIGETLDSGGYFNDISIISRNNINGNNFRMIIQKDTAFTDCQGEVIEGITSEYIRKHDTLPGTGELLRDMVPDGTRLLGSGLWDFGPDGTCWDPAVELVFSYNTMLLGGHDENDVFVAGFNPDTMQWEMVPSTVDQGANEATVMLSGFSTYGVFAGELPATTVTSAATTDVTASGVTTATEAIESPGFTMFVTLALLVTVCIFVARPWKRHK